MKFKKGHIPHNKGKSPYEETKRKISESTRLAMKNPDIRYKCGSATRGKKLSEETKMKMSESHRGKIFSEEHRKNLSKSLTGNTIWLNKKHSNESKEKIGKSNSISLKGHKQSKETRLKRRIKMIEYIKQTRGGFSVNVGKNEKFILDSIEEIKNIKIERNFQVLGYFPDGYCRDGNIIYEVYEKYHDKQIQKDLDRETEICNYLGCDFIIIWDEGDKLCQFQ